jgi:hypothetical protein
MSNRVISEDILRGIVAALERHAPELVPTIHNLIRTGLADGPTGKIGKSVYGKLTGGIPWEQGEPVLRALEAVEREYGYQTQFAGRQINFLVMLWRRFAEPQQLPRELQ